jgi:hypothetical protein
LQLKQAFESVFSSIEETLDLFKSNSRIFKGKLSLLENKFKVKKIHPKIQVMEFSEPEEWDVAETEPMAP